ncbi:UNVERIFIED_CONTAM: hypothetical protein HDU68_009696 [Siphonaria sp. JEL0065]|nr:hypothetical protein HDU68_009696 [Siphonaria sp. JEL0065]
MDPTKAKEFFDSFESTTQLFSECKAKFDSFLQDGTKNETVGSSATSVSEAVGKIVDGIGSVADAHPILKLTWLVVSAGYKLARDTVEEEAKFKNLVDRFAAGSSQLNRLKSLKTNGIPLEMRTFLAKSLDKYLYCLVDVVKLYLDHLETSTRVQSAILGTNSKKLDEINVRLDEAQADLSRVGLTGSLAILVSVTAVAAGIKTDTVENLSVTKTLLSEVQALNAKLNDDKLSKDLAVLRGYLQYTEIHGIAEISSLTGKRNPNTRGWIIDRMMRSILNSETSNKIVWLFGEAGTGKSVISGCVAEELSNKGLLAASFFCQHDNKLRDNTSAMIQTLCYELASKNENYRKRLVTSLLDSKFKDKFDPTVRDLISIFIDTPFQDWPANVPCVIAIDALDELGDHSSVSSILEAFHRLKKPVKLFLTSRPDVVVNLKGKTLYEVEEFDVDSDANKEDIRIFTRDRLNEMVNGLGVSNEDLEALVSTLSVASSGLFIWITLVLGNVGGSDRFEASSEEGVVEVFEAWEHTTRQQLVERLQQSATLDLQSLYCRALFKAYPTLEFVADFKSSVGVILDALVPLSPDAISQILLQSLEGSKLSKTRVNKIFKRLKSLLKSNASGKLSFIHKTVNDYLKYVRCHSACSLDVKTCTQHSSVHCCHNQASKTFQIDFDAISFSLAHSCLSILNAELFQNMAKLDGSVNYEGVTFPNVLPEQLEYAVLYWSDHFVAAFTSTAPDNQLVLVNDLHRFSSTKLPIYLEALLLTSQLNKVVGVVNSILNSLNKTVFSAEVTPKVEFIRGVFRDFKLVAYNFRPQLLFSPLQAYRHALIAVPQDTPYYKTFHAFSPMKAHLAVTNQHDWGPFTISGHGPVECVAYSADGKLVVSGSIDSTIKVWNPDNGECIKTLQGHIYGVRGVVLSSDNQTVFSCSNDTTIRVWDLALSQGKECYKILRGHTRGVISLALSGNNEVLASASEDDTVKIWNLTLAPGEECIKTLRGHLGIVASVALSSDAKTVVSGSVDKTIKVWNLVTGGPERTLFGHERPVNTLSFSADGKTVVSGSADRTVKVWDLSRQSGQECVRSLEGHDAIVHGVALSFDAKTIVSGSQDNTIKVWNIQTGTCIQTLGDHLNYVTCVALSADGRVVSGSRDKTVKVWGIFHQNQESIRKSHSLPVTCIALSADGKTVLSGSGDSFIRWDLSHKQAQVTTLVGHTTHVNCISVSADGTTVASASMDKTIKVWNGSTCVQTLKPAGNVMAVALTLDGKTLVTGSWNKTVGVYNLKQGQEQLLRGHTGLVTCVAVSADGAIIGSGSADNTVKLWDLRVGEEAVKTLQGHTFHLSGVAVSANGKIVVSEETKAVKLWDVTLERGKECVKTLDSIKNRFNAVVDEIMLGSSNRLNVSDSWVRWTSADGDSELLYYLPVFEWKLSRSTLVWKEGNGVFALTVD